jgi:5-methyltetrahydrofolate--homocysteine methyltransferase
VGVVSHLIAGDEAYHETIAESQTALRARFEGRRDRSPLLPLEEARQRRALPDWDGYSPPSPARPGVHVLAPYPLADLVETIDWAPFLATWEIPGRYPDVLDDPVAGPQARSLLADARALLDRIVEEELLEARAVLGLWPAHAREDDVVLFESEEAEARGRRKDARAPGQGDDVGGETGDAGLAGAGGGVLARVPCLRQQFDKPGEGRANRSLSDYVRPAHEGGADWMGAFAVTAGIGLDALVARYEAEHDDYHAILARALADRLAESLAERLHQRVRTEFWGYAPGEELDNRSLISEAYQGIRPAPGYPACPDHTGKRIIFDLLNAPGIGMELTESLAMTPAASVAGWYFAHPEARYFGVGRIGRDQLQDYARRAGMSVVEAERWLAPSLGYDPEAG